jgi:tRNA(Ile)-lysidine synthase
MLKPEDLARLEANAGRLIVAYSGGSDSHVLLQYLQANLSHPLEALHVNHGLSANAAQWQQHCEAVCDELSLPLTSYSVEVSRTGSLEANARAARYTVFELALKAGDLLLMGHHRDDQIETILLNLLLHNLRKMKLYFFTDIKYIFIWNCN